MITPDGVALRKLIDNAAALTSSLLSLGSVEEILNAILIHLVVSKIDSDSTNPYNELQDFKEFPTWDKCYSILSRRCQFLENKIQSHNYVQKVIIQHTKSHNPKKRVL